MASQQCQSQLAPYSTDELSRAVLTSSDPSAPPPTRSLASSYLDRFRSSLENTTPSDDDATTSAVAASVAVLVNLLRATQDERILFFALTALQRSYFLAAASDPPIGAGAAAAARAEVRNVIFGDLLGCFGVGGGGVVSVAAAAAAHPPIPTYLRTKIGVVVALLVRADFVIDGGCGMGVGGGTWAGAFDDLIRYLLPPPGTAVRQQQQQHTQGLDSLVWVREEIFLRTLDAASDEIVDSPSERNTRIKDAMRGLPGGGGISSSSPALPPDETITARLVGAVLGMVLRYRPLMGECSDSSSGGGTTENDLPLRRHANRVTTLSLWVLRRYLSWIDLSLILTDGQRTRMPAAAATTVLPAPVLPLLFSCYASSGPGGDDVDATSQTNLAVAAVKCIREIVGRGMDSTSKVKLIADIDLFRRLHDAGVDISNVDVTHIDVVIAVSDLINMVSIELLQTWDGYLTDDADADADAAASSSLEGTSLLLKVDPVVLSTLLNQLVVLFFQCFAYDDIDVSGAVIPLASRLAVTLGKEMEYDDDRRQRQNGNFGEVVGTAAMDGRTEGSSSAAVIAQLPFSVREHLPQILNVMYRQMRYPAGFEFDYEDDDEAEEEVYRSALRKLYQSIIRISPELSLRFLCTVLSGIPSPLSTAPTPDLEAALRLIYHYCEGIRPPPGMKVVMKDETFRQVLIALHGSDVTSHTHREVLMLYYDIAVRYHPILKERPDMLPGILGSMSGTGGLQHPHPRMRSRACYLLQKLVRALCSVMRPYVETAVGGIQGLLSNPTAFPLEPDDKLYLFETIGLLLGKTGLDASEQQRYLTAVMTPHVRSIEGVLNRSSDLHRDPDHFGALLAASISAIAYLSKGFSKPGPEVQVVLTETVGICLNVLRALPENDDVRSKSMILLQRMILCLGDKVLPSMPSFLDLLISKCDGDILDVSHLLLQLCSKFKRGAIDSIDAAILPFLRKVHSLVLTIDEVVGQDDIPPHLRTEQLSIKKLSYVVLQHVVTYQATSVLLSSANVGALEEILQTMSDGAINVHEPGMKKSCIVFFRGLVEQWAAEGSLPSEHLALQRAFVQFVFQVFASGMIRSFLEPTFNEKDAMQSRNVYEMGKVLSALKVTRGSVEFEQHFIVNVLVNSQCPDRIVTAFRAASNDRGMDACLKEMIGVSKGSIAMPS